MKEKTEILKCVKKIYWSLFLYNNYKVIRIVRCYIKLIFPLHFCRNTPNNNESNYNTWSKIKRLINININNHRHGDYNQLPKSGRNDHVVTFRHNIWSLHLRMLPGCKYNNWYWTENWRIKKNPDGWQRGLIVYNPPSYLCGRSTAVVGLHWVYWSYRHRCCVHIYHKCWSN